jgi:glutamine synthetase
LELGIIDCNGKLRTRTISRKYMEDVLENGFGFDGSSVGLAEIEDSDMVAIPDTNTLKIFEDNGHRIGFMLCDVFKNDKPFEGYSRFILKKVLQEIKFDAFVGPEVEFYVKKPELRGNKEYMNPYPIDEFKPLKRKLILELERLGFDVKLEHHEVGDGQHEITFKYDNPLAMADKIIFYKYFLRMFFAKHELQITFMPKPFFGFAGNGMHCHFSLWKNNNPLFVEDGSLTENAFSFIAGILAYAKEITSSTNSCVNSFKRLVPGYEAPCYIAWGYGNRSTLIRVPAYSRNDVGRVEIRSPDPLCNPYMAFASILMAGVNGIKKKLKPPEPVNFNVYELGDKKMKELGIEVLPRNLNEAIIHAERGMILKNLFGDNFRLFMNLKKKEWKSYVTFLERKKLPVDTIKVTEWEHKNYFYA